MKQSKENETYSWVSSAYYMLLMPHMGGGHFCSSFTLLNCRVFANLRMFSFNVDQVTVSGAHVCCVRSVIAHRCFNLFSGIRTCFACKQSGSELIPCSMPACGRFYHTDCIGRVSALGRRDSSGVARPVCPLHICASCTSESTMKTVPKICKGG
jgi:hypothetical protein